MPNPTHLNDDFLDIAEVAAWLHITERHVRRLVAENRIPKHKIGGLVRLRRSEINAWIDSNGQGPSGRDHGRPA
jgi:excisionase family DNA binding protein